MDQCCNRVARSRNVVGVVWAVDAYLEAGEAEDTEFEVGEGGLGDSEDI